MAESPSEFEIVWTQASVTDLDLILDHVGQNSGVDRASKIYDRLVTAIDSLQQTPRRGRVVPELNALGIREFREIIHRPFRIVFRIHGHQLVLVGILDARRNLEDLLVDRALRL